MNLQDLENLMNKKYIQEGQAFLFWDIITNKNTEKLKNSKFNKQKNDAIEKIDDEFYLFDLIPMKSIGMFIFSALIFLIIYSFQINFFPKDGRIIYFLINFLLFFSSLYFLDLLYNWKYYFSSTFCTLVFINSMKLLLDYFCENLGFTLEEYDIFNTNLINSSTQNINNTMKNNNNNLINFYIKTMIILIINIPLGILVFFKYNHFSNYIIFYTCFTYCVNLFSEYFKYEVNEIFRPFGAFNISLIGIINVFLIYFHSNEYYFDDFSPLSVNKVDSLYFIGDFFTAFCFCFVMDYINYHVIKNSKTIYKNQILEYEEAKTIPNKDKDKIVFYYTRFTSNDFIWFIIISTGFYMNFIALVNHKYSLYHISLFFLK